MSSKFNLLPDDPGEAEAMAVRMLAEAVRMLAEAVRTSMARGEYPWSEEIRDVATARQHQSSFGLSPEFSKWEARFVSGGGVWWVDETNYITLNY